MKILELSGHHQPKIRYMIHVIPNREISQHEESTTCKCLPSIQMEDEIIVVHNELTREERESDYITDEDENLLSDKNQTSAQNE